MLSEMEKRLEQGAERKGLSEPWRHIRCTYGGERNREQRPCERATEGRTGLRPVGRAWGPDAGGPRLCGHSPQDVHGQRVNHSHGRHVAEDIPL